jgi:hypothetical protein
MAHKIQNCSFVLLPKIHESFPKRRFFRVMGTLERIFHLKSLDLMEQSTTEKKCFLMKIQENLGGFLDSEILLGVLEYKGSFLLLNFELILKDLQVIVGKRYFFYGEITTINNVLILVPSVYSVCGEDLDLFVYEKTVEIMETDLLLK